MREPVGTFRRGAQIHEVNKSVLPSPREGLRRPYEFEIFGSAPTGEIRRGDARLRSVEGLPHQALHVGKVLVVHEDPAMLTHLARLLLPDYVAAPAMTLAAARALLPNGPYAAAMLDVELPDGSGVDPSRSSATSWVPNSPCSW